MGSSTGVQFLRGNARVPAEVLSKSNVDEVFR
jgi:hypothetical protein